MTMSSSSGFAIRDFVSMAIASSCRPSRSNTRSNSRLTSGSSGARSNAACRCVTADGRTSAHARSFYRTHAGGDLWPRWRRAGAAAARTGGKAVTCHGGYRVSGAWDYASACDHATHFIGAAMIEGSDPPRLVYALLDRSAFVIVDNWDTIGMRGTGSKRVAADGVFVPNLRTITAPGTSDEVPPG